MSRSRLFNWRRVVVYAHRWLGIAGCLLFVSWFVSGIVMMYARMPQLTSKERLDRLPVLDLTTARVSPSEAASRIGVPPQRLRVGMLGGRPVYRLLGSRGWATVFADTAQSLVGLTEGQAIGEVRRLAPEHAHTIRYDGYLTDADQWTLQSRGSMPMHRVALGDSAGTYLYLSDRTGEPVMKTTSRERRWAYAGAVLHWIYFTPFRRHSALWAQSIIWVSVAGSVLCLSGLVWGVWRYSPISRYRLKHIHQHSPYAAWMRWHHYAGLFFGLTTFAWIFSGLLSMDPWDWHPGTSAAREQRDAVAGGPLRLDALTLDGLQEGAAALAHSAPKEIEVLQFRGDPFLAAGSRLVSARTPERGAFEAFDRDAMMVAARAAMPGIPIVDAAWLTNYDAYYYDRHGELTLPMLRVRYGDAERTWLYLDPRRGTIARKEERLTRVNRWLYHGLHSLDFPFLYYRRPLWDALVIILSLGGIVSSATVFAPAWRRLRRHGRRLARRHSSLGTAAPTNVPRRHRPRARDDGIVSFEEDGMTDALRSGEPDALITGDQLARMPDSELCELIDGRIVPMSPTNPEHGHLEARITAILSAVVEKQNLGRVMTGEVGIFTRWNPDRVRGADVLFISHARYERRTKGRGFLDVAPELVVEILSPENSHIDTVQKVREYLAIGVLLVLVVDPPSRTITAYRPSSEPRRYADGEAVPCGDVLPSFDLAVATVFE